MIKHFISLFNSENCKRTTILFAIAALLITGSLVFGITDNLPMILMFFVGIIFIYFAVLHIWKKVAYFSFLLIICLVILTLDFIWPFINEDIAMSVGFICFAGLITGIIGIFTRLKSWNRLPYAAALLSVVALGILLTLIIIPLKKNIPQGYEWILIGLQLFIIIILFGIGIINKKESKITKTILIIISIILILICIWALYASSWQFEENAIGITSLMLKIYSIFEIMVVSLSFYACFLKPKN